MSASASRLIIVSDYRRHRSNQLYSAIHRSRLRTSTVAGAPGMPRLPRERDGFPTADTAQRARWRR